LAVEVLSSRSPVRVANRPPMGGEGGCKGGADVAAAGAGWRKALDRLVLGFAGGL
jgi:hypothetical protein